MQTKSPSPCATDSFQPLDVPTPYQPDTDATRVKQSQAERFLPYPRPRTRGTEHTNAEAGPSTLPPPHIPSVDPSTIQPSGEESETTADAEQSYSNVEEDEVMVSNFTTLIYLVRLIDHPASESDKDPGPERRRKTSKVSCLDEGPNR